MPTRVLNIFKNIHFYRLSITKNKKEENKEILVVNKSYEETRAALRRAVVDPHSTALLAIVDYLTDGNDDGPPSFSPLGPENPTAARIPCYAPL